MKRIINAIVILSFVLTTLFTSPKTLARTYEKDLLGVFLDALPVEFYVKAVIPSQVNKREDLNKDIPILMFHNVAPWRFYDSQLSKSLTVEPKLFREMMDYLYKHNFTPITLKELNEIWQGKGTMPQKPIVLTFDDGDYGVYKYAYPVLKERKFHFVVFLITRYINVKTRFYLKKSQILEMLNSGLCEIGSHTRDHVNLKKCSLPTLYYEISASTSDIKNLLHYTPTSFCYPFGGYTPISIEVLKKYGYNMGTTENYGFANKSQNHLLLRRIRIDGRDSLSEFIRKVGN